MVFKFVVFCAALAAANAGLLGVPAISAYSAPSVSYAAPAISAHSIATPLISSHSIASPVISTHSIAAPLIAKAPAATSYAYTNKISESSGVAAIKVAAPAISIAAAPAISTYAAAPALSYAAAAPLTKVW